MAAGVVTDAKVDTLRTQLPAVQTTGYFNSGSNGPIPRIVYEAADAEARRELDQGRIVPGAYIETRERNRWVAALAAEIFGADADEIALTHSTTEGLGIALMGLSWTPGDEIISTLEEHPGLMLPLALLARRYGVITRYADIGDGASRVVEALASQITSRTRLIALSHVIWSTGAVLPLGEISGLARHHKLIVVIDGAQSAGQVPIDLHAMGIHAYAMAGQKWLCGPEATGLLYVRKDRFPDIAPTYARYGQFDPSGYFIPAEGAKRYEVGEFYSPAVAAQETALRWLRDDVGFVWAHDRIVALGADFRNRLTSIDGVTVITPIQPMAGLVNFNIEGLRPQVVTSQLFERGYTIRYVETAPCSVSARVSVGWWNTEEEVAGLAGAIADLAREARNGSG
jgi:L-cysteine/cystine lyase